MIEVQGYGRHDARLPPRPGVDVFVELSTPALTVQSPVNRQEKGCLPVSIETMDEEQLSLMIVRKVKLDFAVIGAEVTESYLLQSQLPSLPDSIERVERSTS